MGKCNRGLRFQASGADSRDRSARRCSVSCLRDEEQDQALSEVGLQGSSF